MSLHYHLCATCPNEMVCCCADKSQEVLCDECKDWEKALREAYGDVTLESRSGHAERVH